MMNMTEPMKVKKCINNNCENYITTTTMDICTTCSWAETTFSLVKNLENQNNQIIELLKSIDSKIKK